MIVSSRIRELSPFLSKVTLNSFCSALKHLLKTGCVDHRLFSIIKGYISHEGEKLCWGLSGAVFPFTLILGCSDLQILGNIVSRLFQMESLARRLR